MEDNSPSHLKEFEEMKDEDDYARFIEFLIFKYFLSILYPFKKYFRNNLSLLQKSVKSLIIALNKVCSLNRNTTGLDNHIMQIEEWLAKPIYDVLNYYYFYLIFPRCVKINHWLSKQMKDLAKRLC